MGVIMHTGKQTLQLEWTCEDVFLDSMMDYVDNYGLLRPLQVSYEVQIILCLVF